ncbi:hypothetical protein [Kitasatospora sp. NPDC017646]|uniref:hypothetical protein n=1 Tax=Kitasatospora sp. NPDC017646 TaxID=3364024 RepID=UPI00379CB371
MSTAASEQVTRSGMRPLGGALALVALSTALITGTTALDVYVNPFLASIVGLCYPVIMLLALVVRRDADCHPAFQKRLFGWGTGISGIALVAYLSGSTAWTNLILESGRTVQAVVLNEKTTDSLHGTGRAYTLASTELADEVPGGPLEQNSPRFRPGDVITVRMDPAGRVAPKLPGEVGSSAYLVASLGCNAAIAGILLWSARRPRSTEG